MKGVLSLLILGVLLVGCSTQQIYPLYPIPTSEESKDSGPIIYTPIKDATLEKRDFSNAPDSTWIYPGKFEITNMYPGARAEGLVSIRNGGDRESKFLIYFEDFLDSTLQKAPDTVSSWIKVSESSPIIKKGEIKNILVVLDIPEDAKVTSSKWGFLIVVSESSQSGMVKVRNASKWLVSMRQ